MSSIPPNLQNDSIRYVELLMKLHEEGKLSNFDLKIITGIDIPKYAEKSYIQVILANTFVGRIAKP